MMRRHAHCGMTKFHEIRYRITLQSRLNVETRPNEIHD